MGNSTNHPFQPYQGAKTAQGVAGGNGTYEVIAGTVDHSKYVYLRIDGTLADRVNDPLVAVFENTEHAKKAHGRARAADRKAGLPYRSWAREYVPAAALRAEQPEEWHPLCWKSPEQIESEREAFRRLADAVLNPRDQRDE